MCRLSVLPDRSELQRFGAEHVEALALISLPFMQLLYREISRFLLSWRKKSGPGPVRRAVSRSSTFDISAVGVFSAWQKIAPRHKR